MKLNKKQKAAITAALGTIVGLVIALIEAS